MRIVYYNSEALKQSKHLGAHFEEKLCRDNWLDPQLGIPSARQSSKCACIRLTQIGHPPGLPAAKWGLYCLVAYSEYTTRCRILQKALGGIQQITFPRWDLSAPVESPPYFQHPSRRLPQGLPSFRTARLPRQGGRQLWVLCKAFEDQFWAELLVLGIAQQYHLY